MVDITQPMDDVQIELSSATAGVLVVSDFRVSVPDPDENCILTATLEAPRGRERINKGGAIDIEIEITIREGKPNGKIKVEWKTRYFNRSGRQVGPVRDSSLVCKYECKRPVSIADLDLATEGTIVVDADLPVAHVLCPEVIGMVHEAGLYTYDLRSRAMSNLTVAGRRFAQTSAERFQLVGRFQGNRGVLRMQRTPELDPSPVLATMRYGDRVIRYRSLRLDAERAVDGSMTFSGDFTALLDDGPNKGLPFSGSFKGLAPTIRGEEPKLMQWTRAAAGRDVDMYLRGTARETNDAIIVASAALGRQSLGSLGILALDPGTLGVVTTFRSRSRSTFWKLPIPVSRSVIGTTVYLQGLVRWEREVGVFANTLTNAVVLRIP